MSNEFEKAVLHVDLKPSDVKNLKKAIADYLGDTTTPLIGDPDLMYNTSVLVSEGSNKNRDGFLREILYRIFRTPRNKFVNFEHDTHAENKKKNPDGYQIIGHIYNSYLKTHDGQKINDIDVYVDSDGKWLRSDSGLRDKPVDIVVDWVLYQFEFPEIANMILEMESIGAGAIGFGVSMEVLFSDYKFRVGQFDPNESFEFDGASRGLIEARKGTVKAEELKVLWENGEEYNSQPITRILGGNIFFSGMAITANRANNRSYNLVVDKGYASIKDNGKLGQIIKAVAEKSKNPDFSVCKLEGGEPSCGCLETTLAAQLNILKNELEALARAIEEREDVNPKEGKKKFGDVKFADPVNNKYPIDTEKHIRAAWNYINQEENAAKYSTEEVKLIKSRIVKAWKEKIDKDGPPSAADAAKDENVKLNKPMKGDVKKYKVYVKNDKGNVVKVNFGDPNMEIKRDDPARRKSFRARHKCDSPGPKWKPRYWSCKFWSDKPVSELLGKGGASETMTENIDTKFTEVRLIEDVFGLQNTTTEEWVKKVYTDSFNYEALSDSFLERWADYINAYIIKNLMDIELHELFEAVSTIEERNNPFIEDVLFDIADKSFSYYFDDEDEDEDEEDKQDYLKLANKKLQELYENNIDDELSGEEVREYLDLVEKYLLKSKSLLQKHI